MPKLPNPKAKTLRLVLIPKDGQECQIRAFKELCSRNDLKISDVLFEKAVQVFLREHNWPPGNSQTVMPVFLNGKPKSKTLCACGQQATRKVTLTTGEVVFCCSSHMPHLDSVKFFRILTINQ